MYKLNSVTRVPQPKAGGSLDTPLFLLVLRNFSPGIDYALQFKKILPKMVLGEPHWVVMDIFGYGVQRMNVFEPIKKIGSL